MIPSTGLPSPETLDELRERLADTWQTLRILPTSRGSRAPAEHGVAWPGVVREAVEAYGYNQVAGSRLQASLAQIGRMDEVVAWIAVHWAASSMVRAGLAPDAGQVAWLRAGAGWSWGRIAARRRAAWGDQGGVSGIPGGNTPPSLRAMERAALTHMLAALRPGLPAAVEAPAEGQGERDLVWVVDVDRTVEERVAAIRPDGTAVVQTRHARAKWREIPARGRRRD